MNKKIITWSLSEIDGQIKAGNLTYDINCIDKGASDYQELETERVLKPVKTGLFLMDIELEEINDKLTIIDKNVSVGFSGTNINQVEFIDFLHSCVQDNSLNSKELLSYIINFYLYEFKNDEERKSFYYKPNM